MNTPELVLKQLLTNEQYLRKVIPYIKGEYFAEKEQQVLFNTIEGFFKEYNAAPSVEAVNIIVSNRSDLNDDIVDKCVEFVSDLTVPEQNLEWLVKETEAFVKDRALYNALKQVIKVIDDPKVEKGMIPQLMTDALSVGFDTDLGHDYLDDAEERYDYYHLAENRIPFHIDILNQATKGGVLRKTLNLFLAGTNVGKTLLMTDLAAHYMQQGLNVMYFTMEMDEKEISKRVDANLIDCGMAEIDTIPRDTFMRRIGLMRGKVKGKLKVKEYPSSSASVLQFEHHLNELKVKYGFVPDVICVDYLSITSSSRYKAGAVNSYTYYKAVAEELRALNQKHNTIGWSAMQLNRSGFKDSDAGLGETSESFGVPMTADWMCVVIATEELTAMNQVMFKQEKSRYSNKDDMRRFVVGMDRNKQRMFDVDQSAQDNLMEDVPLMDNTSFGSEDKERNKPRRKGKAKTFEGFKY